MPQYAAKTEVSKDRSLAEIERTLTRYGATGFIYGWSGDNAMVGFVINNRQIRFTVAVPHPSEFEMTPMGNMRSESATLNVHAQAVRQRYRALALYVKATLEAVEAGIITFEDAFLAYTALPSGGTFGQWAQPQIAQAYETGRMPPLLPQGDSRHAL